MHAPNLDHAALTHQLLRMFASDRERRPLIAIHGTCDDPRPLILPGVGRFDVVRADSELDLRARLPDPTLAAPARTVYLVSWTTQLPLDIAGRFSRDGEVFRIDNEVRLSRLFTAPFETVDPDALISKLAIWLLHEPPPAPLPSPGGRLTFHALWTTWLRHTWSLDLENGGLSSLLTWAASNGLGPRLVAMLANKSAAGVQTELESLLSRRFGEPAPAIFRAWLHERGTPLLGFAVLCETLTAKADDDRALRTWLALKAEPFLGARSDASQRHKILHRLAGLVAPTLAELGRTDQRIVLRAALDAADALADEHVRDALIDSPRLLSSWHQRLAALGRILSEASARPSHLLLTRAVAALRSLEQHDRPHYSRDGRAATELARAEAGVRLLAWLVDRGDASVTGLSDPACRAEQLARWYIDEGSYLDRARQAAHGVATDSFGAGIAALLLRVDEARRELDRLFADGLVAWSRHHSPGPAIQIADALERLVVGFLRERPARRLLVLVLADMAWTHALGLLASLDEDASRWGPLVWHGLETAVPCPTVIATIPSIAPLCRAALLSGRPAAKGVLPAAGGESKRLAEHRGLSELRPGAAPAVRSAPPSTPTPPAPRSSPSSATHGPVSSACSSTPSPPRERPSSQSRPWRARTIRPLFELLDAAQAAGRAVLLASDHGHVPADRLRRPASNMTRGRRPRWRPWTATPPSSPTRPLFPAEDTWGPRGSPRRDRRPRRAAPSDPAPHRRARRSDPRRGRRPDGPARLGGHGREHGDPALASAPPPRRVVAPPRRPAAPRASAPTPHPQAARAPSSSSPVTPPGTDDRGRRRLRPIRSNTRSSVLASPIFEARATEPAQRDRTILTRRRPAAPRQRSRRRAPRLPPPHPRRAASAASSPGPARSSTSTATPSSTTTRSPAALSSTSNACSTASNWRRHERDQPPQAPRHHRRPAPRHRAPPRPRDLRRRSRSLRRGPRRRAVRRRHRRRRLQGRPRRLRHRQDLLLALARAPRPRPRLRHRSWSRSPRPTHRCTDSRRSTAARSSRYRPASGPPARSAA
jgi:hypothetical protein